MSLHDSIIQAIKECSMISGSSDSISINIHKYYWNNMYVLPDSIGLSSEWQRRLDNVKKKAIVAEEGSSFFLEVSSHPVVSLFVVTGAIADFETDEREVHLHFSEQPDCYPDVITSVSVMERMGFNQYRLKLSDDESELDFVTFTTAFYDVCSDIDRTIQRNHGVKCYEDGCITNEASSNVFYLHICDILNIMVNKEEDLTTEVVVQSDMMKNVPPLMRNVFEDMYLRPSNKVFLKQNIDFIYYCFAYLGNKSFVPIRTKIADVSTAYSESKFFMTNDHFVMHQFGKMQEINQNGCGLVSRMAYRTI